MTDPRRCPTCGLFKIRDGWHHLCPNTSDTRHRLARAHETRQHNEARAWGIRTFWMIAFPFVALIVLVYALGVLEGTLGGSAP